MFRRKRQRSEKRKNHISRLSRSVVRGIGTRHMGTYASSTTFYYFLALVPILVFVSAMLPLTGMKEQDLMTAVTAVTPDAVDSLVQIIITEAYEHSGNLIPISVITLLWTSIQGNLALLQGMNDVYKAEEHRSYWRLVLISLLWTALLTLLFLVLVYFIFSDQIQDFFMAYLPNQKYRVRTFTRTRRIICFLIAAAIFAVLYTYMPAGKRKYYYQLPGAVFAAAIWVIFSVFFAMYVNGFNKFTSFYGSLGTLAILLFWMYCCFYILLIGGFINCHFEHYIRNLMPKRKKS